MVRQEALKIIDEMIKSQNLKRHLLATEIAMLAFFDYFKFNGVDEKQLGDRNNWGLVGLLHDADYEITGKNLAMHTEFIVDKIKDKVDKDVIEAIKGHCDKAERKTLLSKAIYAVDELTGLIVAAALVRPDKKLSSLTVESIIKRFKEPSFARGANRDMIRSCEHELGIALDKFIQLCLEAMKKIDKDLGL